MPRVYSLKLRKAIQRLYRFGIRKNSKNFQILFVNAESLKVGFFVAKKDILKASHRVYSKRLIRETVRKSILNNIAGQKMHIGISIKTDLKELIKSVKYDEIEKEVINLFKLINFNAPAFKKDQKRTFHD